MHKVGYNIRQSNIFTSDTEGDVIRDAVSQKVYRHLANPSYIVWIDSTQTKIKTIPFQIGDSLI